MEAEIGKAAVRYARSEVMSETSGSAPAEAPSGDAFGESRGAFVTLKTFPDGMLRGCIGYPYPVFPLYKTISEAARSACHDPRFRDLTFEEAKRVTVEVTVLTVPEPFGPSSPEEIVGSVRIGRDGLMLERRGCRGLLLPQVPVEQGWDVMEYLQGLSFKAGLRPDAWAQPDARLFRFEGEVFHETEPFGEAVRGDPDVV
ncbi:MAG: TIGR00296 family protein [Candidatus Methanomethylophilaceae archaeon]|nr:TIGR00296 family protein [Candidatus Methanomethylophilaceae archaeon]